MAIPPHSKPRHKKAPNKRSIIRWCVGTAMLTATALIISIPLIMRAEDNIQQAANVKAYAATITNTANKAIKKANGRRNSTTRARKPNQQPNRRRTRNAKSRRIQSANSSSHPATSWQPSTTRTRHQPTHTPRNKRTDARHRRRALGRHIPAIGGAGTHTVITAHRGLADKLMFTKLDQAEKVTNSPSPPSAKPSPIKCKQSAPSPPTISPG